MGAREQYYTSLPLGERLKYLRETLELKQSDIAQILHVDRSTYSYYETGKTEPSLASMVLLSRFYKISLDLMLRGLPEVEASAAGQNHSS